jgi:hypothetical protein
LRDPTAGVTHQRAVVGQSGRQWQRDSFERYVTDARYGLEYHPDEADYLADLYGWADPARRWPL